MKWKYERKQDLYEIPPKMIFIVFFSIVHKNVYYK